MTTAIKKKIEVLSRRIWEADMVYYEGIRHPLMSDDQYDREKKELLALESEWPDYITFNSPSRRVGYDVSSALVKRKHSAKMYSLDNALTEKDGDNYDCSELERWWELTKPKSVYLDYKFDGLAVDITCVAGSIVSVVTRGDGETGEDVTKTAMLSKAFAGSFKDVGVKASAPDAEYHIRGEVMVSKKSFAIINAQLAVEGKRVYMNPRNAAAGILRSIHKNTFAKYLDFVPYEFFKPATDEWSFLPNVPVVLNDGDERVEAALPYRGKVFSDYEEVIKAFKAINAARDSLPFEIDGLVYKIVDEVEDVRKTYGYKTRYPLFMIAHKFPPMEAISVLLGVRNQVGRSGEITPVADIQPIKIGGVVVTSPTLNNYNWMEFRRLKPGVKILVRRAGDVIPEIVGALDDGGVFVPMEHPTHCPSCGSKLENQNNGMTITCVNETGCPAQRIRLITHHVSREAMNIVGFGKEKARVLVEKGTIKRMSDIYLIPASEYAKALTGKETISKEVSDLMLAIEKSKLVDPARFLFSLGILGIGQVRARRLIEHFGSFDRFLMADAADLVNVDGIADDTAVKIAYGLANRVDDIYIMREQGVTFIEAKAPKSDKLKGQVWVVTGSFEGRTAEQVKEKIISLGATVKDSVTKDTTDLLVGNSPGTKLKVALAKGIPTRNIYYLLSMEE